MFALFASTLPTTSTMAVKVQGLFDFILYFSILSGGLILWALLHFMIKYKRRGPDDLTPHITGNKTVEWGVVVILSVVVMWMFAWGYIDYREMVHAPKDAMEINVIGRQWLWEIQYPNGKKLINELRVPKGKPVKLIMTSDDVLHSFYVPNFRVKQDLVPGMYTTLWFEATETGKQIAFCAEYCGTTHSGMLADVIVMEQEDFDDWLDGWEMASADEAQNENIVLPQDHGRELFSTKGCVACHSLDKRKRIGPSMAGIFGSQIELKDGTTVLADENYLRESMMEPLAKLVKGYSPVMPTYKGLLSEEELNSLIALIKSLKKQEIARK